MRIRSKTGNSSLIVHKLPCTGEFRIYIGVEDSHSNETIFCSFEIPTNPLICAALEKLEEAIRQEGGHDELSTRGVS